MGYFKAFIITLGCLSYTCDLGPEGRFCRLPVSAHIKYLGIYISNDYKTSLPMNVNPLLDHFQSKCKMWGSLPLSIAGRINLIKIKCLYALQHSPVPIPNIFFHPIESLMSNFIWGRAKAKLRLSSLQRPKQSARMALLDFLGS